MSCYKRRSLKVDLIMTEEIDIEEPPARTRVAATAPPTPSPPILNMKKGDAALGRRMTPALADFIAQNFTAHTHIDLPCKKDMLFEATVWRGKPGTPYADKMHVTTRRTETLEHFLEDGDLGLQLALMLHGLGPDGRWSDL